MSEKNLSTIGVTIETKMDRILKSIGGSPGQCDISSTDSVDFGESEVRQQAQFNKGKPIFFADRFWVLYIKDNTFKDSRWSRDNAVAEHDNDCYEKGNKVHFIFCRTLVEIKQRQNQQESRYRLQMLERDTRPIDLSGTRLNVETRLPWCKNCINELSQKSLNEIPQPRRVNIAEYGNASDILACLKLVSEISVTLIPKGKHKGTQFSAAYPRNWKDVSAVFRNERGYACEECGVACSAYPQLTDAHHINGDKNNCEYRNLQCLCKFHHFKHHPHYKPNGRQMLLLQQLWEEQNIPHDKRG